MRRLKAPRDGVGVSLFPFLAVLLCTMGALVVVLVVLARQGRARAELAAGGAAEAQAAQRDDLAWRIEHMQAAHERTAAQLADKRLELSHLEEHARRLRMQLRELETSHHHLRRDLGEREHDALRARLADLEARRAALESELERAVKTSGQRTDSYAVVPYEGPHATRRRPIYIECRRDSVVFQPEGVTLTEEDFTGPVGPANPLAAALRAAAERMSGPEDGEPYPLLLVRPDGIMAYYAVRAAMASWGPQFGYELIEQDWALEFPEADRTLAEQMKLAVEEARRRQAILARAAPSRYRTVRPGLRAAPTRGGLVRDDHPFLSGAAALAANEPGDGGTEFAGSPLASAGRPTAGTSTGLSGANRRISEASGGGEGRSELAGHGPQAAYPRGAGAAGRPAAQTEERLGGGTVAGQSESRPMPGLGIGEIQSLAGKRGRNWGLPDSGAASVPITRPIHILCDADHLAIAPERRSGQSPTIVPLPDRTEDAIDSLVSGVWDRIESWGIAGRGMYWRPTLSFEIQPGAERRYAEIEALLARSGLDVEVRRSGTPAARWGRKPTAR